MSAVHADIGYSDASRLVGAIVLPSSLAVMLRGIAKGRQFASRRLDTLLRLDELARARLIERACLDAPWTLTEAGKHYLAIAAQRRKNARDAAKRRKRARSS